jgi:hypothetical protein
VTVVAVFLQLIFHRSQSLVYLLKVLLKDFDVALKNSDGVLKVLHQRNGCFRSHRRDKPLSWVKPIRWG